MRHDLQLKKKDFRVFFLLDKGSCCVSQAGLANFLGSNESPTSASCTAAVCTTALGSEILFNKQY